MEKKRPQRSGAPVSEEKVNSAIAGLRASIPVAGYRELSLKIHGSVCARCGREFSGKNLRLLTVHHKDNNHLNNPPDGSNWENLCVYCHDDEHSRELLGDYEQGMSKPAREEPKKAAKMGSMEDLLRAALSKKG
ncbi:HNH nuclease family protein [bacterium]|nr:MAG: HNH nuclease family protein [bacterium]